MTTDTDKLLSTLDITVVGVLLARPAMLADVLKRVGLAWADVASKVVITCQEPERDGSLMYYMTITYRNGGGITIGALRRNLLAATEFHS